MNRAQGQQRSEIQPQKGRPVSLFTMGMVSLLLIYGGWAGAPVAAQTRSGQTTPSQGQERFLQHFISTSLAQTPAVAPTPTPVAPAAEVAPGVETPPPSTPNLTTAALKMVLSLGLMLALVVGGGYGVRRYLLDRPLLGKRDTATLRVLSRVSITPKAGVALVEVPGKILVVGLTGSAMTLLGEVPAVALREAPDKAETVPEAPISSFDTALQHQVHNLEPQPMDDDPLLSVSQAIHRKVSSLKQL